MKILFCGRYLEFFHLNTLNGTTKVPAVDHLRLTTLRGTKTAFLTAKRYDEHPNSFYMGVPRADRCWPFINPLTIYTSHITSLVSFYIVALPWQTFDHRIIFNSITRSGDQKNVWKFCFNETSVLDSSEFQFHCFALYIHSLSHWNGPKTAWKQT